MLGFILVLLFATATSSSDEGVGIDPFGRNVTADYGCGIDPNGSCRGASLDTGVCIDPQG